MVQLTWKEVCNENEINEGGVLKKKKKSLSVARVNVSIYLSSDKIG